MLEFEENPLPPPNYPSCRYCGKFFETAWHIAVHQWKWNCGELNQATKDQKEGGIE